MRVAAWLHEPLSAVNALAVVELEPGEVADVEAMLALLDGTSVGHFGVSAELVGQEGRFDLAGYVRTRRAVSRRQRVSAERYVSSQFGYPPAHELRATRRYYVVHVHRD